MRVEMRITSYMLSSGKIMEALRQTFGGRRTDKYAHFAHDLIIECTADQMVRFLIQRDAQGASNDWKGLQVKELCAVTRVAREIMG
jgi:hypothetical protein